MRGSNGTLLNEIMTDTFVAFDQFRIRHLYPSETVYVLLAEFENFALLVGKLPEQ